MRKQRVARRRRSRPSRAVVATASAQDLAPTIFCTAGEAAIAMPPSPYVSMIAESPVSRLASAAREARKVEAVDDAGRAGEPLVAECRQRGSRTPHRCGPWPTRPVEPSSPSMDARRRLRRAHRPREEELIVVARDEPQDRPRARSALGHAPTRAARPSRRASRPVAAAFRMCISSPIDEGLRHEAREIDRPSRSSTAWNARRRHVTDPARGRPSVSGRARRSGAGDPRARRR